MGCCQSTPRANDGSRVPNDDNNPSYPQMPQVNSSRTSLSTGSHHAAQHNRTASSPTRTAIQVSSGAATSRRNRRNRNNDEASKQNPAQKNRPNAPLQPAKSWRSTSRTWTPSQLNREREVFWDTRVTGRDEIWAALKLAVEMIGMRAGNRRSRMVTGGVDAAPDEIESERDIEGAQAVLDAAGVTCPTGRMGEGVWDERGVLYKIPRWVVSDPVNVQPDIAETDADVVDDDMVVEEDDEEDEEGKEGLSEGENDATVSSPPTSLSREKEKKGDKVRVRARRSDGGPDVVVEVGKSATARTLAKEIIKEASIQPTPKRLRLAYMGKILRDSEPFTNQGWQPGHVLNALIFP